MKKDATISPCGKYRYLLTRDWNHDEESGVTFASRRVAFIGLNPSTADAENDDPTIRRCIGFAKTWGFNGLVMVNLFAYRATKPEDMMAAADPVGPDNLATLENLHNLAEFKIAAWGKHGSFQGQGDYVKSIISGQLCYLRLNKDGSPAHPLYLPKTLRPTPFAGELDERIPVDDNAMSAYAVGDQEDRNYVRKHFPHLIPDLDELEKSLRRISSTA